MSIQKKTKRFRFRKGDLSLEISSEGPRPTADSEVGELTRHPAVREILGQARYRVLSCRLVDRDVRDVKTRRPLRPKQDRTAIYDYSNNRVIEVTRRLDTGELVDISEFGSQPLPSRAEFDEAVERLREDPEIGDAIRAGLLQPYRPMPPLVANELPDGREERTLAVGLLPASKQARHEIVGVNMIRQSIERYEGGAPATALADGEVCHPAPNAGQPTESNAAGQVRVTVRQGNAVLWRFRAVRPSASSGTNGSGIELRYVDYRGKRVLYRAHVPILNVRYDKDACGPYRDWQNEEGMIQANGTDVAPGFRFCPTPATTILDTGSDAGNFLGTAIYVDGQEVVLVNEMQAGWYRYVSEWRLHANGTIRPRFGFDAVASSCTCKKHFHHAYWRFDFDIRTAGDNLVEEFNNPPLFGSSSWHTKNYEIRRSRNSSRDRRWRVSNKSTGEGYTLIPGANDGNADSFGVGDLWILRYRGSELDDGTGFTTDPAKAKANLDGFVNGESINGKDVVLWYAGHFTHDVASGQQVSHIVGPDLKPDHW